MEPLNYFKDKLFDLLNETNEIDINDIEANDRKNTFLIAVENGRSEERRVGKECRL